MCGRFTLSADGETICSEFGLPEMPFSYRPRYNIAPMQDVLAVVHDGERSRAGLMRWGLVPSWADDPAVGSHMINARSETINDKSAFKESFERRRCLIVADGFYEWKRIGKTKIPMRIHLKDDGLFAFAGIWDRWSRPGHEPLITCSILTTTPSPSIASIHDRMPVILGRNERDEWLDRSADPETLESLLKPVADGLIEAYPVAPLVNHVENDSPECVEEVVPPAIPEQTTLFG